MWAVLIWSQFCDKPVGGVGESWGRVFNTNAALFAVMTKQFLCIKDNKFWHHFVSVMFVQYDDLIFRPEHGQEKHALILLRLFLLLFLFFLLLFLFLFLLFAALTRLAVVIIPVFHLLDSGLVLGPVRAVSVFSRSFPLRVPLLVSVPLLVFELLILWRWRSVRCSVRGYNAGCSKQTKYLIKLADNKLVNVLFSNPVVLIKTFYGYFVEDLFF